jgi:hypothetical protein
MIYLHVEIDPCVCHPAFMAGLGTNRMVLVGWYDG